jgi:hypothetical protein
MGPSYTRARSTCWTKNKTSMATKELRDLRHKYKEAYTTYMSSVQALSDASQNGVWPEDAALGKEERAFNELTLMRQALLDALQAHTKKG